MRIAIVGAGITGCSLARALCDAGHSVDLFEKRSKVGGLCADGYDSHGVFVQWQGAHIFHTNDRQVFEFLSRFTDWIPYRHEVWAKVANGYMPMPVNAVSIAICGSKEEALAEWTGAYGEKMWGEHWRTMGVEVEKRVAPRANCDGNHFYARYQGIPLAGYSTMMQGMLDGIVLRPEHDVSLADVQQFDRVFLTTRLDRLLKFRFGPLQFRSLCFDWSYFPVPDVQPFPVVNYPSIRYPFLRTVEPKKFTRQYHCGSSICTETAVACGDDTDPTHVVPTQANRDLYARYRALLPSHVIPVGRFAQMEYWDMDRCVSAALKAAEDIT